MIGPVSGTGRAMMSSLQQAIQKGMPPEQAVQYVKSMATQGVAPLADLYAMMNQFQRLKQQQVQPPQTPPTIKDQLNMAEQQQMQAAQQPMDRGLGAIDAGRMQYPQFAGGGIVAFQDGGFGEEIDFTKMSVEQLRTLASDENREIAKAAYQEFLRRTGYTAPQEYLGKYVDLVKQGIPKGGAFNFDLEQKFPDYMYDEQGNIRRGEITAGIGGLKEVPSSRTMVRQLSPETPERFAQTQASFANRLANPPTAASSQSAVPTAPVIPPSQAGSAFDTAIGRARENVRQDITQTPASRRGSSIPSISGFKRMEMPEARSRESFYEELKAAQEKEGIGETARKREAYLTNEEARLKKEYGSDKMLAFAEAGFKMAGAASRPGATFLGALAEGAMSGTQALRALNKEQRASRRAMDEARFQLAEAAEQRKLGNMKDATILSEKAKDRYDQAQKYNMDLENDIQKLRITTGAQLKAAEISAGERAESRALAGKSFQLEGLRAQVASAEKRLIQASKSLEPDAAAKVAGIEREIAFYNDQIAKLGGTQAYAGAMGTESAIPDAVLQAFKKYR